MEVGGPEGGRPGPAIWGPGGGGAALVGVRLEIFLGAVIPGFTFTRRTVG